MHSFLNPLSWVLCAPVGQKQSQHYSRSVFLLQTRCCTCWQESTSTPQSTTARDRSPWHYWLTACKYCLCSRRSCSCRLLDRRCQKPRHRSSHNHYDPNTASTVDKGEYHRSCRRWSSKPISWLVQNTRNNYSQKEEKSLKNQAKKLVIYA